MRFNRREGEEGGEGGARGGDEGGARGGDEGEARGRDEDQTRDRETNEGPTDETIINAIGQCGQSPSTKTQDEASIVSTSPSTTYSAVLFDDYQQQRSSTSGEGHVPEFHKSRKFLDFRK